MLNAEKITNRKVINFLKENLLIINTGIRKNNKVALRYNKYLGWNKLTEKSRLFKQIKKKFIIKGFNFYSRNDYDKKF